MSFTRFILAESEKKVTAKSFESLCKVLEKQITSIQDVLDSDFIKMSGSPNVSGMLNKLQGALEKSLELSCKVVETIGERKEQEDVKMAPQKKMMSDAIGTGVKKSKK